MALSFALLVSACSGGSDQSKSDSSEESAPPTSTPRAAPVTTVAPTATTATAPTTLTTQETVANNRRPTSFAARIEFDGVDTGWYNVDAETGEIGTLQAEQVSFNDDPQVSPDGKLRFESVLLNRHPDFSKERIVELVTDLLEEKQVDPEMDTEYAASHWRVPALVDVKSGEVVTWYNVGMDGEWPWYRCGLSSAWCDYGTVSLISPDYLIWSWGWEGSQTMLSRTSDSNLFDGFPLGTDRDTWLHPVEQASGNIVVAVARTTYDDEIGMALGVTAPFGGAVVDPVTGELLASFAIGDGATGIADLDYDESGTWLLATLDNAVEWQGRGEKGMVQLIDPEGRSFFLYGAAW
ncbi:MAG: hypothetical protein ACC652_08760 [Acidimicrobiales bacterium]